MPYKDREQQKAFQRGWAKKKRESNPAKLDNGQYFWKGGDNPEKNEEKTITGTVVELKRVGDRIRYFVRTEDGKVRALETTKYLGLLLQENQVICGDVITVDWTGNKKSKKNGHDYKTYKLVDIKRRYPLLNFGKIEEQGDSKEGADSTEK